MLSPAVGKGIGYMDFVKFPYRHADAVLNHKDFMAAKKEIKTALGATRVPVLDPSLNLTRR